MLLARVFFDPDEWSLPDWLTVVGFPGVAIGLLLAARHITEIKRTSKAAGEGAAAAREAAEEAKAAADAASEAIGRTERRIADQNLLMLVTQAQRIADDLDRLTTEQDVLRLCSEWIGAASELQGILQEQQSHTELVALLRPSIESAGAAKNGVIERKEPIVEATAQLRNELIEIRAATSRIMGRMRAYLGEQPNG
jgi:hypothetical protein